MKAQPLISVTPRSETNWLVPFWRHMFLILACCDILTIYMSFGFSYYSRFYLELLAVKQVPVPGIQPYIVAATVVSMLWIVLTWRSGGYEPGLLGAVANSSIRGVLGSGTYAIGCIMALSFMVRDLLLSRQVFIMAFAFASLGMVLTRIVFKSAATVLSRGGYVRDTVLVIGMNEYMREFVELLSATTTICVAAHVPWSDSDGTNVERNFSGRFDEFLTLYDRYRFNHVVVSLSGASIPLEDVREERMLKILNYCEGQGISVYVVPHSFDVAVSPKEVGTISGVPMIRLQDASLHPAYAIVKRTLDVCFSLGVLLFGLPVWLLIAVLIKIDSDGPVLFTQLRAGLHGKPFRLYKFRSMRQDAEAKLAELVDLDALTEPVFKIKGDPRVTRIGKFLRKTGLDEIPQFMNVMKGEMSIVGPRPEEVGMVERYNAWQKRRLKAKPGITGYQQISNRGEPSLSRRVKYDLIYLKRQNLFFDLYVMCMTFKVLVRGAGLTH
jgi:exopolysaccharide biosynthesis polyprenyl glycosylphosphotransferase